MQVCSLSSDFCRVNIDQYCKLRSVSFLKLTSAIEFLILSTTPSKMMIMMVMICVSSLCQGHVRGHDTASRRSVPACRIWVGSRSWMIRATGAWSVTTSGTTWMPESSAIVLATAG